MAKKPAPSQKSAPAKMPTLDTSAAAGAAKVQAAAEHGADVVLGIVQSALANVGLSEKRQHKAAEQIAAMAKAVRHGVEDEVRDLRGQVDGLVARVGSLEGRWATGKEPAAAAVTGRAPAPRRPRAAPTAKAAPVAKRAPARKAAPAAPKPTKATPVRRKSASAGRTSPAAARKASPAPAAPEAE